MSSVFNSLSYFFYLTFCLAAFILLYERRWLK
nr:MAG TPA: hypothetical protein [Caudoviricetes sp.]